MRNLITSTLIAGAALAALTLSPAVSAQTVPSPSLKPVVAAPIANIAADIAVAKVRDGKLVLAPFAELRDFAELEMRLGDKIGLTPITPDYVSRTIHAPQGSDNAVDEIRMTAAAKAKRYTIIYGFGPDAGTESLGRVDMTQTGLIAPAADKTPARRTYKAVIVGSFTGKVYATVTSDTYTNGVDDLTRRIEAALSEIPSGSEPFIAA